MKKVILAFSLCVLAFTVSASNSTISLKRTSKHKDKKEQKSVKKRSSSDACQICTFWPGGGACGSGETCEEAMKCLKIAME